MERLAVFRTKCPACGEWIEKGDSITFDADAQAFVHAGCDEEPRV